MTCSKCGQWTLWRNPCGRCRRKWRRWRCDYHATAVRQDALVEMTRTDSRGLAAGSTVPAMTDTPAHPRRPTRLLLAAAIGAAILLAGATGWYLASDRDDTSTAAAPATTTATVSPSPSKVSDGEACDAVVSVANEFEFDPAVNQANGRLAAAASDRGIALAGQALVDAANAAMAEPGPDTNIDIMGAQLDVAQACADSFGRDGPWG